MKTNPSLMVVLALLAAPLAHGDAVSDLTAKAEEGEVAAQLELAGLYAKGQGVRTDMAEALKWYTKAAGQGNVEAQMKLGGMYIAGKVVRKDSAEAAKWFMMAADSGNAAAQCQMGRMHMVGAGVAKDDVEAYKWASLAAAQNDPAAKQVLVFLARRMTREQITFVQTQSREYQKTKAAEKTLQLPAEPAPTAAPE